MTSARIQLFWRKHFINTGYFSGEELCSRSNAERNIAIKMHKNRFCLIWKSNAPNFIKAIEESKNNLEVVDNGIFDKHVKNFVKYES